MVSCRYNVKPGDTTPVDIVADRVALVIEAPLREMCHPLFKQRAP